MTSVQLIPSPNAVGAPTGSRVKSAYVTAFPGRRDGYQVPLSLAENGRLASFVTCFYRQRGILGRMPGLSRRIVERHAEGIDRSVVECMELTNLLARVAARVFQPSRVGVWEDIAFARRAVEAARRLHAGLLLYEFQADWAFRQPMGHDAPRILFQFHPHPDFEHPHLLEDGRRYPRLMAAIRSNTRSNLPEFYRRHTIDSWRRADHVIVASRFTARSLEAAGCPPGKISVVPYGCGLAGASDVVRVRAVPPERPYFLFVGSGTQRKGLHHLLEAWNSSTLSASHDLVVVARVVDPELRTWLATSNSVRHLAGVGRPELERLYGSAVAFVMPSLSEGFGHVYLEALSCGCPVIGTRNSALPDFEDAQAHVRYAEPGNPESIRAELEWVAGLAPNSPFFLTESVRESVRGWTSKRFRDGIESVLVRFDA
jgi:glycosyltransferase involved in cell wall biosynthesis